ncbi:MAG: hypothetical protein AAFY60_12015 [Myxococcota bacterium]
MSGLIGYDRGVHLRGTPLWFDPLRAKPLAVMTSVPSRPPAAHERLVVPQYLADQRELFKRVKSVLPTPMGRWVGVGGQQMELWPTGGPLSAAALVVTQGNRVLISGAPRLGEVQWPSASHLVLPAPEPGFKGASLDRVLKGLDLFIESAQGAECRIQVDDAEVAVLVSDELLAMGHAHRRVGWLGKLAPLEGARALSVACDGIPGQRARVARVLTRRRSVVSSTDATFRFDRFGSMSRIGRLAREIGAKTVTLLSEAPIDRPENWPNGVQLEVQGGERQLVFQETAAGHRSATN